MTDKKLRFEDELIEEDLDRIAKDKPIIHLPYEKTDSIFGGIKPRTHILVADPAVGKTTLTSNIACWAAAQGQKVIFANLEIDRTEMVKKGICSLNDYGLTMAQINEYQESGWSLASMAKDYVEGVAPNIAYTGEAIGAKDLVEFAEQVKEETGQAPFVFVDYVQILDDENASGDERMAIAQAMDAFHTLNMKVQSPVFAISSIKRQDYARKKAAGLNSLAASQTLEYGADIVMHLSRADGDAGEEDGRECAMKLHVIKNRYGVRGTVDFIYDTARAIFFEC